MSRAAWAALAVEGIATLVFNAGIRADEPVLVWGGVLLSLIPAALVWNG